MSSPAQALAEPLSALGASLDAAWPGQADAKTGLLLALLAREHAYLEGPPGCGKSQLAGALAAACAERTAAIRFHRDTGPQDLLGDAVIRRVAGPEGERLEREIAPGRLLSAQVAVLDDLSRAPGEALGPLLRILSQRTALGRALPLETAVATSVPPALDAYADPLEPNQLDRFAVQVRLRGLVLGREWRAAREALDRAPRLPARPVIGPAQRAALQRAAARLSVENEVERGLLSLVRQLREAAGAAGDALLTDRAFGRTAVRIMRAHALLRGAERATLEDLGALRFMLGRRVPEAVWESFEALLGEALGEVTVAARAAGAVAGARPGAVGAGARMRVATEGAELRDERLEGRAAGGADAAPPAAEVDVLLGALGGRIERGRVDACENPGGSPRSYRTLRRLDEVSDADPLEAALFAAGRLPGGPRVFRRERREASGSLAVLRDVSASMEGRLSRWAAQVVAGIVRLGARYHMRLGYIEFNHHATRYLVERHFFHRGYRRLLELAWARRAEGRTNYEAPLELALDEFRGRPGRNRHLVLLTDGVPVLGDPEVRRERARARRLGVRIHTVFLGLGECPEVLDRISLETAGLRFSGRPTADGGLRVRERA